MKNMVLMVGLMAMLPSMAALDNVPAVPRTPVITYGLIRDEMGAPLDSRTGAQVRLVGAHQPTGQVYAVSAVEPNIYLGLNYRLSLEMDSKGPSRSYAAIEGMPMKVVVLIDGEEQTLSPSPLWDAPKPGTAQRIDYTIAEDSDNDGLPDTWEWLQMWMHYDNPDMPDSLEAFDAKADYDGDGMTNLQEFFAGTDPFEKTDLFAITSIGKVPGTKLVKICFTTSRDHMYHLLVADSLAKPVWTPVATTQDPARACTYTSYAGTGHEITVYVDESVAGSFFKVACH